MHVKGADRIIVRETVLEDGVDVNGRIAAVSWRTELHLAKNFEYRSREYKSAAEAV
jgi:hypothetical protein